MAIPNKVEKYRNRQKADRKKERNSLGCERQFPDCPETMDLNDSNCKLCPHNGQKKVWG